MTEDLTKIGKTLQNETRKSRKQIYVFLICLVLSSILWLFVKLSEEISLVLPFPVEFVNIPDDYILQGSSISEISLQFNEKAAALLVLKHIAPRSTVEIDLASVRPPKNADSCAVIFDMNTLRHDLNQTDNLPFEIITISPDTVMLSFVRKYHYDVLDNDKHHDGIK
jgi:hypothetical protein